MMVKTIIQVDVKEPHALQEVKAGRTPLQSNQLSLDLNISTA